MPPTPEITLCRQSPTFIQRMSFKEEVSRNLVNALIKSGTVSDIPYSGAIAKYAKDGKRKLTSQLEHLRCYYAKIKSGVVSVKYCRSPKHYWGRVYPEGLISLGGLPKNIRNVICERDYIDFDIAKAHPSIIKSICGAHNIDCDAITDWIENQQTHLETFAKTYSIDDPEKLKTMVKDIINSTLYGGTDKNKMRWCEQWGLDDSIKLPKIQRDMVLEIKHITEQLSKLNPVLNDFVKHLKHGTNDLTFLAYYAQEHEIRIVSGMLEKLWKETNILKGSVADTVYADYEYDGFKLLKNKVLEHFNTLEDCCAWLNDSTRELTGIELKWEVKPIKSTICLSQEQLDCAVFNSKDFIEKCLEYKTIFEDITGIKTDAGMARFINDERNRGEFLFKDGVWYCWNSEKNKWRIHPSSDPPVALVKIINKFIPDEYKNKLADLKEILGDEILIDAELLIFNKTVILMTGYIEKWQESRTVSAIITACKTEMSAETIEFDKNGWLLGFDNGLIDLKTNEFRPYTMDDRMTKTCGYDFDAQLYERFKRGETSADDKYIELMKTLEQVQPNPDVRKLVLIIYASGMVGHIIEKFIIFNGRGRNGKGLLNELFNFCMGGSNNYCYGNAPCQMYIESQTKNSTSGANVALASINNMRMVICKEPQAGLALNNDSVKLITGGEGLNARKLYSAICAITVIATFIMECNTRPLYASAILDADKSRIIDVEFPSKFSDNPAEIDNVKVFMMDPTLKTRIRDSKQYFMMILLDHLKLLRENCMDVQRFCPACVIDRTNLYLEASVKIHSFFDTYYERGDDLQVCNKIDIPHITIESLITKLHNSSEWSLMSNKEKAKPCWKVKQIKLYFEEQSIFKSDYVKSRYFMKNGVRSHGACMNYWREKPSDEDVMPSDEEDVDELPDE